VRRAAMTGVVVWSIAPDTPCIAWPDIVLSPKPRPVVETHAIPIVIERRMLHTLVTIPRRWPMTLPSPTLQVTLPRIRRAVVPLPVLVASTGAVVVERGMWDTRPAVEVSRTKAAVAFLVAWTDVGVAVVAGPVLVANTGLTVVSVDMRSAVVAVGWVWPVAPLQTLSTTRPNPALTRFTRPVRLAYTEPECVKLRMRNARQTLVLPTPRTLTTFCVATILLPLATVFTLPVTLADALAFGRPGRVGYTVDAVEGARAVLAAVLTFGAAPVVWVPF
jgi:hypothetical protein